MSTKLKFKTSCVPDAAAAQHLFNKNCNFLKKEKRDNVTDLLIK